MFEISKIKFHLTYECMSSLDYNEYLNILNHKTFRKYCKRPIVSSFAYQLTYEVQNHISQIFNAFLKFLESLPGVCECVCIGITFLAIMIYLKPLNNTLNCLIITTRKQSLFPRFASHQMAHIRIYKPIGQKAVICVGSRP